MGEYVVSARKYRPADFDEVVGQEHITATLHNAIKNEKLAQTLLFCGPRGVGKTTCARIVARLVNGDQDGATSAMNVFELDAASNNSVDDVRNLTDQVRYPPQTGRYKVYIIDEVHMLSNAAFNAFLKTLEEPPSYAVFVLATTEKNKVIPTVLSRCQIFDFNRISVPDIKRQLRKVADREKITAEDNALYLIAKKADGAMRDALSMFDRMASFSLNRAVTLQDTLSNLHILDHEYYFDIVESLLQADLAAPLLLLDEILKKGFDGRHFIVGLSEHLRNLLVACDPRTGSLIEAPDSAKERYMQQARTAPSSLWLSWLALASRCDTQYRESKNPRLTVELALMKMAANKTMPTSAGEEGPEEDPPTPYPEASQTPSVKEKPRAYRSLKELPYKESNPRAKDTISTPAGSVTEPPSKEAAPEAKDDLSTPSKRPEKQAEKAKKKTPDIAQLVASPENNKPEASDATNLSNEKGEERASPIDRDRLKKVLDEFAEQHKAKMMEYHMLKRDVEVTGNTITLCLSNALEEPLLQGIKTPLLSYLRKRLNNGRITVTGQVSSERKEKIAYTGKEKFEALAKDHPILRQLKDRLGLDVDY